MNFSHRFLLTLAVGGLVGLGAASVGGWIADPVLGPLAGLWAGFILVCVTKRVKKSRDWLSPDVILSTLCILGYGLPLISHKIGLHDPFFHVHPQAVSIDTEELWAKAGWLANAGLYAFLLGYFGLSYLPGQRPVTAAFPEPGIDRRRLRTTTIILMILGAVLFTGVIAAVGIGNLLSGLNDRTRVFEGLTYFLVGPLMWGVAGYLLFLGYLHRTNKSGVLIAVMLLYFGSNVFLGSKTNVAIIPIVMLITYHYFVRKVSGTMLVVTVMAGLIVVGLYDSVFREYMILGHFADNPYAQDSVWADLWARMTGDSFFQQQILMTVIDIFPRFVPFQHGGTLLPLLYAPIPRSLYPAKPISPAGMLTWIFDPHFMASGSSVPPSLFGELYMNAGPLGIMFGMFTLGIAFRIIYNYVLRKQRNPLALGAYSLTLAILPFLFRGESFGPAVLYLILLPPLLISLWFVRYRRRDIKE